MASGEMSDAEFRAFNDDWMNAALPWLCDGGVFGTFIDWRGYPTVFAAASKLALNPLNLIVWTKTNAGMGSLYRSQYELLPLYKKGYSPHVNNIELGRKGRWRSNVWIPALLHLARMPGEASSIIRLSNRSPCWWTLSSILPTDGTSCSTLSSGRAQL